MGCSNSSQVKPGHRYDKLTNRSITLSTSTSRKIREHSRRSRFSSQSTVKSRGTPTDLFFHNNRNFPAGDPNQGSLKKRLRRRMTSLQKSSDLDDLQDTLKQYEELRIDADELYFKAVRRVEYLRMRNLLRDAVRRRHFSTLRDAVSKVEESDYSDQLTNSLHAARGLLEELRSQWDGQPVRLGMGYSSVSEVRRFKSPPQCVVDSVKSCYVLVGTLPRRVKTWAMIRALMCRVGQDGILSQMALFDPGQLTLQQYEMADKLIRRWDEYEVANVSLEAASFWNWANKSLNRKYNQLHKKSGKQ